MSEAVRIFQGRFGRVALLDMNTALVGHAHHHCHILIKASGADSAFRVRGKLAPLTKEDAVLVNAWEHHAYEPQSPESTLILALYIEPSWLADIQRSLTLSGHPRFFPQPNTRLNAKAQKLVESFAIELCWTDELSPGRLEQLLFELVIQIIQTNNLSELNKLLAFRPAQAMDPRIRRSVARLRQDKGLSLNADTLAQEAGLSRAHFFSLFRRDTQVTPLVYSNVLRFESAVQHLTHSSKAVADIADDLGFTIPSHFSRFFREHLGITPSDYRRKVNLMDKA
jgi:AraC family transcriptional regulator